MFAPEGESVLETFIKLIEIPSPSFKEGKISEFVSGFLSSLEVDFFIDDAGVDIGGETGNIIAMVPGTDESRSLLLSAHLDTVENNEGLIPNLSLDKVRTDGKRILGADDKAAVAAILSALRQIKDGGLKHIPIEIVFSVAEEKGLFGAKALNVESLRSNICFVLDGSGKVGNMYASAPSQDTITATFKGVASHAGVAPEAGKSAIVAASKAIASMNLGRIDSETTANIGIIEGGKATNIVPDKTFVKGEARSLDPKKLSNQVAHMIDSVNFAAADCGISVDSTINREYEGFSFSENDEIVKMGISAIKQIGLEPKITWSGGGSDANVFNQKGIASINMGIGAKNVHSSAEYIEITELEALEKLVIELVKAK